MGSIGVTRILIAVATGIKGRGCRSGERKACIKAFAGHLGELELASISIANTVIVGSILASWCLLPTPLSLYLGMASALETLCGQAFGAKKYHMLGIYMQRSWIVLSYVVFCYYHSTCSPPRFEVAGQPDDVAEQSGLVALCLIPLHFSFAFQSRCRGLFWLWEFVKLSTASGVMLCLENWYYRILILMTGNWKNAEVAVDALSVWVRVANELGAGNGKGANFATKNQLAMIFTSSTPVLEQVDKLSFLLAITILLNSGQNCFELESSDFISRSTFSRVAVGSGWQAWVAYINLGCYYIIGLPLGIVMGWVLHLGVAGVWGGMIVGGTALQTLILSIMTMRTNWKRR
ncbi:Protein detoxification 27 [Vitis vinifera]|uniref:Protein detoxification 27 n=1 Tax=Vitis vinifera TaxID=29760 RepID=A0A438FZZ2_VITVI|nr:Protein detoxification 27 [Vitis vinifera]